MFGFDKLSMFSGITLELVLLYGEESGLSISCCSFDCGERREPGLPKILLHQEKGHLFQMIWMVAPFISEERWLGML